MPCSAALVSILLLVATLPVFGQQKSYCGLVPQVGGMGAKPTHTGADDVIDDLLKNGAQIMTTNKFRAIGNSTDQDLKQQVAVAEICNATDRYIFYNPSIIEGMQKSSTGWAQYFILAHEMAHHINGDTLVHHEDANVELYADEIAAEWLTRLGASMLEIKSAVDSLKAPEFRTGGYPSHCERVAAAVRGYNIVAYDYNLHGAKMDLFQEGDCGLTKVKLPGLNTIPERERTSSPTSQAPGSLEPRGQSSPAHALRTGMTLLPLDWMSVNSLQQVGGEIFLGGHGNSGGTFGKYEMESGKFSDLSYLLPKPWCPVSALAYGGDQVFIGGASRGGCAGLFSPTSDRFQDMTPQLRAQSSDIYYYGGVGAVSFNGREFLVGGSGKRTSLELYSPATRRFTYLGLAPYFAVNTISSDGNSFLIAGAGPGPGPQQPPAVGWISPTHTFTSLTAMLPGNWGTTRRSAYDGNDFLIVGVDGITGANQMLALITPLKPATEVTNSFPAALNVHAIDGHDGYFLVAGQLEQKAYLARYRLGTRLTSLSELLPEEASDVTAVKIIGNKVVAAGVSRTGQLFIVTFQ